MPSTIFKLCLLVLALADTRINATAAGTCDEPFIIFKHTVATSNSKRECANTYKIFPDIHDEGADKFHDGECAYQCKLELPYTCFRIHAPQTTYAEGLLYIDTFEQKMSEKWKNALNTNHPLDYDNFFDFNMGFWVQSLDSYIAHWQSNSDSNLEYFGIEWYISDIKIEDSNFRNNKFYSILVHSPSSQINFEFISYTKPSKFDSLKWITDTVPRCTFKTMNPLPWMRPDKASIVPVRISHATTDIHKLYDFYVNVLEGQLLYYAYSNDKQTQTIFMHLLDTNIEIQFVQRPLMDTFGDFRLDKYESLLMETHASIITSPFCGQDRWMDNHFAYSTWTIPGLMDRIYYNLNRFEGKYRVGKNVYTHSSTHTKYQLDLVGYTGEYTFGLWVIEPTGQTMKIGGIISDTSVGYFAPFGDPQWCEKECNFGLMQGRVDSSRIYVDDLRFTQHNIDDGSVLVKAMGIDNSDSRQYFYIYMAVIWYVGGVLLFGIWYYCMYCNKNNTCNECNDYVPV